MPLGTLRKKTSAKDISRRSKVPYVDSEALPTTPQPGNRSTLEGDHHQEPEYTTPPRRPSSSHIPSVLPQSDSAQHPSSPDSAQLLNVPRARQSLKYASEPNINAKYKAHAQRASRLMDGVAAPAPTIGLTAPSRDEEGSERSTKRRTLRPFGHAISFRTSSYAPAVPKGRPSDVGSQTPQETRSQIWESGGRASTSSMDRPAQPSQVDGHGMSGLRYSESSAQPSGSRKPFAATNGRTGVGAKASSFFKFSRRKKNEPLFPLPVRVSPTPQQSPHRPASLSNSESPIHRYTPSDDIPPVPPIPGASTAQSKQSSSETGRNGSATDAHSTRSSPPVTIAPPLQNHPGRSRSGTMGSNVDHSHTPNVQDSGRNSTASTTLGRNSIAGLRSLTSRLRHPSEALTPRHGSPGGTLAASANNSFALSRETLVVPEREEGESAGRYYIRLEHDMPKRSIALALAKSADPFNRDVLRSLARTFKFFEEPMDMSLRKFLWEVSLPGEAQQIERVVGAFAERYHECNPHIFKNFDQTMLIAFSLVLLHSDLFNPNNKTKMQRYQYIKNLREQDNIPPEILGYFYDNIQYTELIHQHADEDGSETKSKSASKRARRVKQRLAAPDANKNGRIDPYVMIIDEHFKLDSLKPVLKDQLVLDDRFRPLGNNDRVDILSLRKAFFRFGTLQITSARSRPEAFTSPSTIQNPQDANPGVVDIKVAKVGTLWRKSAKRKKTRSPWQEWGAVLTSSQLFFFRNVGWVKNLCHQADVHYKQGNPGVACVFKPPLQNFQFEGKVSTEDAVAVLDMTYRRHKHAFALARRGSAVTGNDLEQHFDEVLLADSEWDRDDWIHKINYASTFKTSNVRIQSWHPANRNSIAIGPAAPSNEPGPAQVNTAPENKPNEKNLGSTALAASVRAKKTREMLDLAVEQLHPKQIQMDDYIGIGRHLEILSPMNDRTRSDLLSYGVRLAHNIKWSHYEVARLQVHRDILIKEMQEDESKTSTLGMGVLDADDQLLELKGRPSNVKRNSRTDPLDSSRRDSRSSDTRPAIRATKSDGDQANPASYRNSDILNSIDEAFATPMETITHIQRSNSGNLKLLDLRGGQASRPDSAPYNTPDSPGQHSTSSLRPSTASSASARPQPESATKFTPTQSLHEADAARRPSTASTSGAGKTTAAGSPQGSAKSNARRSMHRTLREPKDALSQQTSRTSRRKKSKDKEGDNTDDNMSGHGSEGLLRQKGSFTVHGKKASVITIPEFEQRSAEERLRLRKQAASDASRNLSVDGTITDEGEGSVAADNRLSAAFSDSAVEDSAQE